MQARPLYNRVVVIGPSGVGKTNLVKAMVGQLFDEKYSETIGADFYQATTTIRDLTLQIWDTAGNKQFQSFSTLYFSGAAVVLICYDVADPASLDLVDTFVSEAKQQTDNSPSKPEFLLVGLKSDADAEAEAEAVVTDEQRAAKAKELGLCFFGETSAKKGTNIQELVNHIAGICQPKNLANIAEIDGIPVIDSKPAPQLSFFKQYGPWIAAGVAAVVTIAALTALAVVFWPALVGAAGALLGLTAAAAVGNAFAIGIAAVGTSLVIAAAATLTSAIGFGTTKKGVEGVVDVDNSTSLGRTNNTVMHDKMNVTRDEQSKKQPPVDIDHRNLPSPLADVAVLAQSMDPDVYIGGPGFGNK